jgi:hypothetical protein
MRKTKTNPAPAAGLLIIKTVNHKNDSSSNTTYSRIINMWYISSCKANQLVVDAPGRPLVIMCLKWYTAPDEIIYEIEIVGYNSPFVVESIIVCESPADSPARRWFVDSCKAAYDCFADDPELPTIDTAALDADTSYESDARDAMFKVHTSIIKYHRKNAKPAPAKFAKARADTSFRAKRAFMESVVHELHEADPTPGCRPLLK